MLVRKAENMGVEMTFEEVIDCVTLSGTKDDGYAMTDIIRRKVDQVKERVACEQALLFGRAKRAARERASERRSREGPAKGELATIPFKFLFVLRLAEGKYHWLKNDVPEIKVD